MGRKKLENMSQTHGKTETFKPTTLDQIWGDTGNSKYGTLNEEEYESQLNEMNKSDLQTHATKIGLVPIDDRVRLTKRLLSEFRVHVASYKRPEFKQSNPKISKEVAKILAEGR